METKETKQETLTVLSIIIIVLSVYVLLALMVSTFFTIPPETNKLLNYIDNIVCVVFLVDFVHRFYKADSKLQFMKWGWIDLLASIPAVDVLRTGRLVRLFRLIRILRAFRSTKVLIDHIFKKRVQGTFTAVTIVAILMIIFSSIAILNFETAPNSNIQSAEDAIWWSFVTITTVGYGDKYPVTTEGRIIAALLMVVGVGLFGTFTGFLASWFVADNKNTDESEQKPGN